MIEPSMDELVRYLMMLRTGGNLMPPQAGFPMMAQAQMEESPTVNTPQGGWLYNKLREMLGPNPIMPSKEKEQIQQLEEEEKRQLEEELRKRRERGSA